ncbi:Poly-beta-1,6-N-acetyl-D-glucosamine N-deacetylase [Burkholderia pseudomultivorans]|uniref:Poly-beta-1,6-N-acetyl-D-glucosamine N-deacetylase n=2 Tax=Burkholderia pseudomultivorans TaxID=1207504 RepID=A0ABU2E954_9BURK|nr:Poly-beta-1,6-N-acetyl-D-glucosamine N-deacetylase [Burkholderia pseudomultivorans]MDR8732989.1 Poly-beta-1,6-N-acetyl-D-glucosamine N-deacetylase [Burkholderia pseudomultivorans]MDR8739855.1 Poly-beta-1,6-N-acetyl-D-glucosamine N-deacetylase [Burkholderia pseudomultivorans]MDR8756063.1 Poly-beta-1,6-N-acetyl-D-glucosamine N-deacetylase [Burkholderia pseudomultivorans]MDR8775961.1 Poly-beta-1,6-N-acetyl-D-glucosamine N-deacetylase [Burkholderia pseudomultivorans]
MIDIPMQRSTGESRLSSWGPILMYHQIRALPPRPDVLRGLSVDPCAFRRQMRALKALGYRGVSVAELQRRQSQARSAKLFAITFDDGFHNVFEHALPVLDELDFTATCYFVSGKLGGSNDWDSGIATASAALMDRGAMREWLTHGHEVGAHTVDHVALSDVPASTAWRQISDSKSQLEDATGHPIVSFCYPYGALDESVRGLVVDAGFHNATTTVRGRAHAHADPFLLPRIAVPGGRGIARFLGRFFR